MVDAPGPEPPLRNLESAAAPEHNSVPWHAHVGEFDFGVLGVFALCPIVANFIMDLLNLVLDPRVRTA